MNLKNIILLTGMVLPVSSAFAQYAEDALRFSQTEQGTTSRFRALGSAQTALGGDLSSISSNPAGLGMFTKSEVSLTPDFSNSNVSAQYFSTSSSFQKDRVGINQFALAIHNPARRGSNADLNSGWLSFNFGIGFNKTNNLNSTIDYSGRNTRSSFADYLADLAVNPNDALADAAYSSYLVLRDNPTPSSERYFPITSPDNNQQNTNYQTGSQSEVNLAFGANFENRLYIGASIGFASIDFTSDREFIESGLTLRRSDLENAGFTVPTANNTEDYLNAGYSMNYTSYQQTDGSGMNAKLGLIYRISNNIRFGANFITPTWYSVRDSYSEVLDVRYSKANGTSETLPNDEEIYDSDYSLRTPYRLNGGLAITIGNAGLITSDVEYVDYSSIHFSLENDVNTTKRINSSIKDMYQSAVNFRLGAEAKLPANFMVRAGFNTQGNPYRSGSFTSETISGGLGYRANNFYFDLTLSSRSSTFETRPYSINPDYLFYEDTGSGDIANIKDNRTNVFATIGFRF